ncbi:MAG TPA: SDR family NAD(P)-dependent oxidoreductase [Polyangiaceae bacterium]|nr:SDR family NAD(P)-dependent oxidoreductase [Polyangiaceae bacterium]
MKGTLDAAVFGPWAVVTGASSGIGREIARGAAASGLNVALVARRTARLDELGRELAGRYGVMHRTVSADLAAPAGIDAVVERTSDLDVGLFVGNAGFANPGELWRLDRNELLRAVHLKVNANLTLVHHFAPKLVERKRGGILLTSSIGGLNGVPYVAHTAALEAYVLTLGEGLHVELARHGVNVTVLMPGPTLTESMGKLGVDPAEMPLKPMSAERVALEGLRALEANRATHIAGRANRVMSRLMPRSVATAMMGAMIGKKFAGRALAASAPPRLIGPREDR